MAVITFTTHLSTSPRDPRNDGESTLCASPDHRLYYRDLERLNHLSLYLVHSRPLKLLCCTFITRVQAACAYQPRCGTHHVHEQIVKQGEAVSNDKARLSSTCSGFDGET